MTSHTYRTTRCLALLSLWASGCFNPTPHKLPASTTGGSDSETSSLGEESDASNTSADPTSQQGTAEDEAADGADATGGGLSGTAAETSGATAEGPSSTSTNGGNTLEEDGTGTEGPVSEGAEPGGGESEGESGSSLDGGYPENTGADCVVSAGSLARNENLPDPFAMNDDTRIQSLDDWSCRRNEIKRDLEEYEIGPKPEPPTISSASMYEDTFSVVVTTDAGSITLSTTVTLAPGAGPHCVAIGMGRVSNLISGCTQVPFMHDQVVTYDTTGDQYPSDPFYTVHPELWGQVGNYAAWAWGVSRLIDGLALMEEQLDIDMARIGVHGCSYAGKMALFSGALDERVALSIVQESGGGGINAWRTSDTFTARTGIEIEKIDNTNYAWFKPAMGDLDPYSLPHDHHELIAMIAPRAVIALGNTTYDWLGDESGYKSTMAAREVWVAMGQGDRMGFDFAGEHAHCSASVGQTTAVNAFVDRFLKGQDVDTNFTSPPSHEAFELDYAAVIDWTTPTLQ